MHLRLLLLEKEVGMQKTAEWAAREICGIGAAKRSAECHF